MVAGPVLTLPVSVVKPWPLPRPRHLHIPAGCNDTTETHGPPVGSGHVPRGGNIIPGPAQRELEEDHV